MNNIPSIEHCSEDMYSSITPVLILLDKRMTHIELNTGTLGVGHTAVTSEITKLENKWEGQLREVTARIDGTAVFTGGRWFISQTECVEFAEKLTMEGKLQWFIDIVSYLQFATGEKVSTSESQRDGVHAAKVHKTKEQSIIYAFKTDVPPILGGLG